MAEVAPEIGLPSRFHWYELAPALAVSATEPPLQKARGPAAAMVGAPAPELPIPTAYIAFVVWVDSTEQAP